MYFACDWNDMTKGANFAKLYKTTQVNARQFILGFRQNPLTWITVGMADENFIIHSLLNLTAN